MTKKYLNRDILQRRDVKIEEIHVPEWNTYVRVKALSGKERDAFEASIVQVQGRQTSLNMSNIRAKLVALAVVDEDGNRVFSDDDVDALGELNASALDRIFTVALRLSGLSQQDLAEMTQNFS